MSSKIKPDRFVILTFWDNEEDENNYYKIHDVIYSSYGTYSCFKIANSNAWQWYAGVWNLYRVFVTMRMLEHQFT